MHAKPDLRVFLKWMIAGSGSVITDVIPLNQKLHVEHESLKLAKGIQHAEASSQIRRRSNCRFVHSGVLAARHTTFRQ